MSNMNSETPKPCPLHRSDSDHADDMVWSGELPETCLGQCRQRWENPEGLVVGPYDLFNGGRCYDGEPECTHEVESTDYTIAATDEMPDGTNRVYSTLDECTETGAEIGSQSYRFRCPYASILTQLDDEDAAK